MRQIYLVLVLLASAHLLSPALAQVVPSRSGEQISLQKQLETGLKARRPAEFAYIKRIVLLVEQNRLPRKLVDETFVWAKENRRYPYAYFQRALRVRAARMGIRV